MLVLVIELEIFNVLALGSQYDLFEMRKNKNKTQAQTELIFFF